LEVVKEEMGRDEEKSGGERGREERREKGNGGGGGGENGNGKGMSWKRLCADNCHRIERTCARTIDRMKESVNGCWRREQLRHLVLIMMVDCTYSVL
jgi:hypothetical protein